MKPEEQRIAIAEASKIWRHVEHGFWEYFNSAERQWHQARNNDPLTDLNAMHEAEKVLIAMDELFGFSSRTTDYPSCRFVSHLSKLVGLETRPETVDSGLKKPDGSALLLTTRVHASPFETIKITHATAAQRAEAFLRTLNLWKQ